MKRVIIWGAIIVLLICYALVVSKWWIEGNTNSRVAQPILVQNR